MKKTLIAFALTTAAVWAAPNDNVYHTIADPTWHVTRIGSRWVIEDSKGFFVGYYVPLPTPPAAVPTVSSAPAAAPSTPAAASAPAAAQGNGAYGYGYNGYGNNGFYGNNYYNNGGYYYNNNANCQPRFHQPPQPQQPQRDMGDVPGTPWKAVIPQ
ncbi:MAG: hypothetical protein KF760_35045 [Candidatus Eremiobacteraeota bacterium]|nr:hypothetical protein [Candidatus Eremiobacteraeota bacterium]MCW5870854.1 hypothetical protein [Candidatus Eremiobacteraeota bacterium]